MEYYDLYDHVRRPAGIVSPRGEPIPEGLYHLGVYVVVFRSDGRMLIQQRQHTKDAWPDYWDVSAGGAVQAGEDPRTAAEREIGEELGLAVSLGTRRPVLTLCSGKSYDDVYIIRRDVELDELRLQPEEVQNAAWADEAEILELIARGKFLPYRSAYISLLFQLRDAGQVMGRAD